MRIRRRHDAEPPSAAPAAAPRGVDERVGESRGGYRLVRLLGVGRRASVYLGHADAQPGREDDETVAVKIFHPAVPEASIDAEIEALSRCGHPHTVLLHDVATAPDGRPCLVLERLAGGSLSRLVSDRERIGPGEAVTILAPLLAAVEAMHNSGVVHGGLRLSSVLFRASGAPVIAGFGSAAAITAGQSEAALALDPAVGRDRHDLVALVRAVLARVPGEAAALVADSLPDDGTPIDPALIFGLADPAPVRLLASSAEAGAEADVSWGAEVGAEAGAAAGAPAGVAALGLASRAIAPRHEPEPRPSAAHREARRWSATRLWLLLAEHARQVRPRFWVMGAAVAASVVAALLLVPSGDPTAPEADGPPTGGASADGNATPGEESGADPPPTVPPEPGQPGQPGQSGTPGQSGSPDQPGSTDQPGPRDDPVLSNDPVAAAGALLAERERCLRDLSVLCLDGVLQKGSAAMERDTAIIRSMQNGGEVPAEAVIAVGELSLVERLGDTALVSLGMPDARSPVGGTQQGGAAANSKPASTLVMRGEAGWRIRDYQ